MSLIEKHFSPHHKLHKLFNRNNVINTHNRNILYPSPTIVRRTCNCITIPQCPLQQKCLSNNILYQTNITPIGENSETEVCYGICRTTFKLRYAYHKKSFNHRHRKSDTELSNEFWKIKNNKRSANMSWDILGRQLAYNTSSKRYSLCLDEKLKTALHRNNNMLNRRTEILSNCRHKNKYALISYDSKD